MAVRRSHQDDIRKKIQADRLIAWMQAGIFGTQFQGKPVLFSPEKVNAAKALLNKTLPDLTKAELTGKDGEPIAITYAKVDERVL
jgi:hypothetical protein